MIEKSGGHLGVEGITMTSVLFCKHGALIMPVTSGQDKIQQTQDAASEVMYGEIANVKKEILKLVEKENGIALIEEYLDEVKANNPDYVRFLDLLAERESGKW